MKRKSISLSMRKKVWEKTGGRCHFCGKGLRGRWVVDHIRPVKRNGPSELKNYLPSCSTCNRLRGALNSKQIKKAFVYGGIAYKAVKQKTGLGQKLRLKYQIRKKVNKKRRKD